MRRRRHNIGLPRRVYIRHNAYYFVSSDGRWNRLCAVSDGESGMFAELSRRSETPKNGANTGDMPSRIDEFLAEHLPGLRSASVRKEYRRLFGVIAHAFGDFSVLQVSPRDVREFLKRYSGTPTAMRAYKARLSTFFSWCVNEELRRDNPVRELKIKKPPTRTRYISHVEFAYASDALVRMRGGLGSRSGRVMKALFDLAYLTAQRCTDIRALVWSRVQPEGIHFRPSKTEDSSGMTVIVPRTEQIEEVLERFRCLRTNNSRFVVHQADGSEYTASALRSAWRRAHPHAIEHYQADCRSQGIEPDPDFLRGATVKDLRAKALTDGERSGHSVEQLRIAAAHSTIVTTEKYLKQRRQAISQLSLTLPTKGALSQESSNETKG